MKCRCFPIVPKLACGHLGLPVTGGVKPTTLLGGLTFFGGAGNNYSMHVSDVNRYALPYNSDNAYKAQAITEMVRQLRGNKGRTGLVLANGGLATYQCSLILSKSPRQDGLPYPTQNPLPEYITDIQRPVVDEKAEGDAIIEVSHSTSHSATRGDRTIIRADLIVRADIYRGIQSRWQSAAWLCCRKAEGQRASVRR